MLRGAAVLTTTAGLAVAAYVHDVHTCDPPLASNLEAVGTLQTVWYRDCYKLSIPVSTLPQHGVARLTDSYCSSFFRCWPMQAERAVLGWLTGKTTSDDTIRSMDFADQDEVAVFRVIARGRSDVLFDSYNSFAFTWLGLSIDHERACVDFHLGSALKGAGYRGIPLQDYLMYQAFMPFHAVYSRLLLKAAVNLLLFNIK